MTPFVLSSLVTLTGLVLIASVMKYQRLFFAIGILSLVMGACFFGGGIALFNDKCYIIGLSIAGGIGTVIAGLIMMVNFAPDSESSGTDRRGRL